MVVDEILICRYTQNNGTAASGEDFLGLRELGIAAKYGMSTLTTPERFLNSTKGVKRTFCHKTNRTAIAVPPSTSIKAPFIALISAKVEDQVGLLKPLALLTATPLSL